MKKLLLFLTIAAIGMTSMAQKPVECPTFGKPKRVVVRHLLPDLKPAQKHRSSKGEIGETVYHYNDPVSSASETGAVVPGTTELLATADMQVVETALTLPTMTMPDVPAPALAFTPVMDENMTRGYAKEVHPVEMAIGAGTGNILPALNLPSFPAGQAKRFMGVRSGFANTNTMALVGFILSLSGFFLLITYPVGAVISAIALGQISRSGESGKGLAMAGLIIGILGTVIYATIIGIMIIFAGL